MSRIVLGLLLGTLFPGLAKASSVDLPVVETPPAPPLPPALQPATPPTAQPPPPAVALGTVPFGPPPGGTELWFEAEGAPVRVYLISGPPAPDTGAPAPVGGICETPCRLFVPNGHYVFEAGGETFSLRAAGGTEVLTVDPYDSGLATCGWIFLGSGIATAAVGGLLLFMGHQLGDPVLDDELDYETEGWASIVVGLVLMAATIPTLLSADGSVERRDGTAAGPSGYPFTVSFSLAPASRGLGGGVRLALSF